MKTIENRRKSLTPDVIINPALEERNKKSLFPEKVKKAKEIIAKYGLPEMNTPKG